MERYPLLNGVVGVSIPAYEIFSLFDGKEKEKEKKLARYVGSQESTHRKVGSKPHLAPEGFLNRVRPTYSNSHRIARRWLLIFRATLANQTFA